MNYLNPLREIIWPLHNKAGIMNKLSILEKQVAYTTNVSIETDYPLFDGSVTVTFMDYDLYNEDLGVVIEGKYKRGTDKFVDGLGKDSVIKMYGDSSGLTKIVAESEEQRIFIGCDELTPEDRKAYDTILDKASKQTEDYYFRIADVGEKLCKYSLMLGGIGILISFVAILTNPVGYSTAIACALLGAFGANKGLKRKDSSDWVKIDSHTL